MQSLPITEDEAYILLDTPFNAPVFSKEYTESDFAVEWRSVRNNLNDILSQYGDHADYGEADYNLGETMALSRGIGVEVTSDKLLDVRLIPQIKDFLQMLTPDYEIDFAIFTEAGISHVFVNKCHVRYWCPKHVKQKLGL